MWERSRWDAQPWLEERMNHSHANNLAFFRDTIVAEYEVWVAVEDGRIIGLLALHLEVVEQLYIDPPHQRKGVGTTLLNQAQSRYPNGFKLFTHQRNQRARAFYDKQGLRVVAFGISPAPENEPDVTYVWEPDAETPSPGSAVTRSSRR